MRSRLAVRSTRLVLAAAAVTALAATTTACGPEDDGAAGSAAPSSVSSASSSTTGGSSNSGAGSGSSNSGSSNSGSSDSGSSGTAAGTDDATKDGYGQSCGTNDLDFAVTSQSQAGGYYLVTAKAKSGITCYLDTNTPSVSFGSGTDGVASPVGQGGEDPIKLTGSTAAYAGISPKTTNDDSGKQFENVIIAVTEDDPNPAELQLPDTATVDKPIVTNWATNTSEAVPSIV